MDSASVTVTSPVGVSMPPIRRRAGAPRALAAGVAIVILTATLLYLAVCGYMALVLTRAVATAV